MSIFRAFLNLLLFLGFLTLMLPTLLHASGFLSKEDLMQIRQNCVIEGLKPVFCTTQDIQGDIVVSELPLIMSVKLKNGVHAFRVGATLTNFSRKIIKNARIQVSFGEKDDQVLNLLIRGPILYKGKSSLKETHLIRSDIPATNNLYYAMRHVYYQADTSEIKIALKEINFIE